MNQECLENVPCNLCGSLDYAVMYQPAKERYNPEEVFSASGGVRGTQTIVKCHNCGLVYVNPRVKPEIVVSAYTGAVDELYVSQEEGRLKTFAQALHLVEKYAPLKGNILDVGCAAGFFLNVAQQNDWKVTGVEPSRWLSEWGREKFAIDIKTGVLKEASFPDEFFDVVTMWDVLEHTPDPMSELAEVNRILKRDGILLINFPNVGSKLARIAGSKWWFFLSVHLYHFTPQTISVMLQKNQFEVVNIRRHYQTLSLEHLIKMMGLYSRGLSNLGLKICSLLRINNWQIPYYASQANVVAKKK
jgi:2-polyprenyl-3-methyl-5-hydroxy-6-metoxy-1,4-benzoquinol methylase